MKSYTYLLAFWLAAAAWPLQADEAPVVFARSGQRAQLPLGGGAPGGYPLVGAGRGKTGGPVALWAFGQRWGEPVTVKNNAVEFVTPKVRVPLVFRLSPTSDARVVFSELVVYPDRPVAWDRDVQLAALGAPDWFDTWSEAVGLPVRKLKTLESLEAGHWPASQKALLLILGSAAAQDGLARACRLAAERETNVLVLEAEWFGQRDAGGRATAVSPAQIQGDLAEIGRQSWPQPLEFAARRRPRPGVVNRWAWIVDAEGLPLVERFAASGHPMTATQSVVASYLPWQRQLGRQNVADATFLALLSAAAKTSLLSRWRGIELVYPKPDALSPRNRPVLTAAAAAASFDESTAHPLYVLDLRGPVRPSQEAINEAISLQDRLGARQDRAGMKTANLLILGDDPFLDEWKWLKLDRVKKIVRRPGVVWLSDDEFPPSAKNQVRLMLTLTALGVPLAEPGQKENEL